MSFWPLSPLLGFPEAQWQRTHLHCQGDSGLGRSPGGGYGNPLHYSCLENPMDRGAWGFIVHGVAKSQTWLSNRANTHITSPPPLKFLHLGIWSWRSLADLHILILKPVLWHFTLDDFYWQSEKQRRKHDKSVRMIESFEGLDLWTHESLTVNWARNFIFFHWVGSLQTVVGSHGAHFIWRQSVLLLVKTGGDGDLFST